MAFNDSNAYILSNSVFKHCHNFFEKKLKSQKKEILILTTISLIGYAMLNNPKGNSQIIGYLILIILWIISILRLFILRSKNCFS